MALVLRIKKNIVLKDTSSCLLKLLRSSKNYHLSAVWNSYWNAENFVENGEFDRPTRRTENRSSKFGSSYQNSQYGQRFQHRKRNDFRSNMSDAETLRRISEIARTPLKTEKFFYVEHPDVTNRSDEEVKLYREKMNLSIKGVNIPKPLTSFSELCLPESLMKVLNEENYSEPSAIQAQGWPVALSGRDLIGVSQTGSGKTLAYMLPAIVHASNLKDHEIRKRECKPHVLVLGPTRELVQQINQVSQKYMKTCGLAGACAYGGASKNYQLQSLKGAEICIATPGRLLDFLAGEEVSMENCSYLVLDEADRMLDMGFEPQIRDIIDQIRPGRQTLMWSATWPSEIRELAEEFLNDFIHITVGSGELDANPNIEQKIYVLTEYQKEEKLFSLLKDLMNEGRNKILVFSQTKRNADYLSNNLNMKNIPTLCIHGDVSQARREKIMESFRMSKSAVLIATDIAARGLDITDIHHVVNYDFPLNIEDYIHRIGRTARGSASGVAHSFFTPQNSGLLRELFSILKKTNQEINPDLYSLTEGANKASVRFNVNKPYRRRMYNRY